MAGSGKMHVAQRHAYILEQVQNQGFVTIPRIARECGVSEMTMRRDLDGLAQQNLLNRTHGGASAPGVPKFDSIEPKFESRAEINKSAKARIARHAANYVDIGQTVVLDIGSTTFELASLLAGMKINIYTTSLKIASHINDQQANVYMPGGLITGTEPSVVGSQAIKKLEKLHFDIAFIGVSGVSENGFYDYSIEDTEIKKVLIDNAEKVIVLIDASKFDRKSVAHVCDFAAIDKIITDDQPPETLLAMLEAGCVDVEIANLNA